MQHFEKLLTFKLKQQQEELTEWKKVMSIILRSKWSHLVKNFNIDQKYFLPTLCPLCGVRGVVRYGQVIFQLHRRLRRLYRLFYKTKALASINDILSHPAVFSLNSWIHFEHFRTRSFTIPVLRHQHTKMLTILLYC